MTRRLIVTLLAGLFTFNAGALLAEDKPSEIPEKLQGDAKKQFAAKKLYYIWVEMPGKAKDLKVKFAVNPEMKAEEVRTVYKLTRAVNGKQIPWTGIGGGGIGGPPTIDGKFKGQTNVTIYLI